MARFMGFGANVAAFDLYLRAHENLYGLPDRAELGEALLAAGFENVAEVAFLPGGAARYIWARVPRANTYRVPARPTGPRPAADPSIESGAAAGFHRAAGCTAPQRAG
jgi:hypothetical protein